MKESLTVSLIQTATHWHNPAANRKLFDGLFKEVPADADLVVLPEMFSTGFTMASAEVAEPMSGPTVGWLREVAARLSAVVCGSLVIEDGGHFYNRFVAATPDGKLVHYDKRHRFRMAGEHHHYAAGFERCVFDLHGWRVCPMVCYDLRFPVWMRNREDYDLLLCVANWPAARQIAWDTLVRARAIENQSYIAAVNIVGTDGNGVAYGGGSAIYQMDGERVAGGESGAAPHIYTGVLDAAAIRDRRREFPVARDADDFFLASDE